MDKTFIPPIQVHPGITLLETIKTLHMSQTELSERSGLTLKTINEIIKGKNPITSETAIKFAAVFSVSAIFWNNLQRIYETSLLHEHEFKQLQSENILLKKINCYGELVKWGYIPKVKSAVDKIKNILKYYGVSSLRLVPNIEKIAFRRSKYNKVNPYCLAAWLRCGEIEALKITLKPFDKGKLLSHLQYFRKLTKEEPEVFVPEIKQRCAECGVAVVFVPHFKKTHVNGATRWINNNENALVQLSLRYAWEDVFWFTLFHEFGHIIEHGKKEQFVELEVRKNDIKEFEADIFAKEILIPKKAYIKFQKDKDFSTVSVRRFANQEGIAPAIIAGRLSHDKNDWKSWNNLRRRFKFV